MSTKTFTGNYKPSGFATETRSGRFSVNASTDNGPEVEIMDGGVAPKVGCVAWLYSWPGDCNPARGAVTASESHCNGRVTVTAAF